MKPPSLALLLLLLLLPAQALADGPRRYAVIIGANEGDASDEKLRFAHRDADEIAGTLQKWGGFDSQDIELMHSPDAASAQGAIRSVNTRIGEQGADQETVLIVYYSGHADRSELHMSGTRLSFKQLRDTLEASPAKVKVLIVDSCRSGEITRVKGAVPAEPFEIKASDRLDTEGIAIITSSSASEDAQESERLRGGVFTHHLVTGLLGAADTSEDQNVTLTEAYDYAYAQTLHSTSRARFVQHPTFAFKMKGKRDLVVTQLMASDKVGRIRFEQDGNFIVLNAASKRVVAELRVSGATELVLDPGRYSVVWRSPEEIREGYLTVQSGKKSTVDVASLSVVRRAPTADKGGSELSQVNGGSAHPFEFSVAMGGGTGIIAGTTESTRSQAAAGLALVSYHLRADLGYRVKHNTLVTLGLRLGIPAGADVDGHATYALAGFARITRSLSERSPNWSVHAEGGLGSLRHPIRVADSPGGMDTDTLRSGPVLLGAGLRWERPLGPLHALVDANALVAPGVFNSKGNASYGVDLGVGLAADF